MTVSPTANCYGGDEQDDWTGDEEPSGTTEMIKPVQSTCVLSLWLRWASVAGAADLAADGGPCRLRDGHAAAHLRGNAGGVMPFARPNARHTEAR